MTCDLVEICDLKNWSGYLEHLNLKIFLSQTDELIIGIYSI